MYLQAKQKRAAHVGDNGIAFFNPNFLKELRDIVSTVMIGQDSEETKPAQIETNGTSDTDFHTYEDSNSNPPKEHQPVPLPPKPTSVRRPRSKLQSILSARRKAATQQFQPSLNGKSNDEVSNPSLDNSTKEPDLPLLHQVLDTQIKIKEGDSMNMPEILFDT
eukprot:TRINITY_DN16036_c0_g1_i1.p1 TRINITY_DN16036_c0_g1~~TRINITY_DN16036_c0_g1_i1.p1  ORF type:complete len:163 (+),score=32.21 TRINITY_DN16036_c0_g1_i1:3-491(+)